MSKHKRVTVTIGGEQEEAAQRAAEEKEPESRSLVSRFFASLRGLVMAALSNLRLSLTLRISLHYAGQLLGSTLLVLLAAFGALCVAQLPTVNEAVDALTAQPPAQENQYTAQQLLGLPLAEAYVLTEPYPDGLSGLPQRMTLLFSDFAKDGRRQVLLYYNTVQGGLVAAYPVDQLIYTLTILLWTLAACDLLRVLAFLRHRDSLDRKVLKPITDMAETAATLSANNLSDRISVEGTKNELKDLAMVINGMLDRIELSYNSQKQFVSDASHELRTPIAVIQGYVGMLERWGKTDKAVLDEGITAISQEAMSMKELVERLLFLARHDKKTLMLEMEDFDPLEVMSEVHREAKLLSPVHHFELEPAQNGWIHGDKGMIKQLMRILVDNAIKYTPADGKITLGARCEGGSCILSVSDTGCGISGKDLPKVFDRFYRCDDARKSQASGHGLGLSIARIIVVAHGGKINVRSKVGTGTTFSAILPAIDSREEKTAPAGKQCSKPL